MSEYCAPQALSAPAVLGSSTRAQPSAAAMGRMLRPAAPPPATSTLSRGLTPSLTVISSIALIMVSLASARIAAAVSSTPLASGSASAATARRAAPVSSVMRPPRKACASM